ncbi:hypothetical protein M2419_005653 [Sphingobacterium sp. BIGb0116]|nr:hypothetical protein [Sphingobacterium sp. BIGb0116]
MGLKWLKAFKYSSFISFLKEYGSHNFCYFMTAKDNLLKTFPSYFYGKTTDIEFTNYDDEVTKSRASF